MKLLFGSLPILQAKRWLLQLSTSSQLSAVLATDKLIAAVGVIRNNPLRISSIIDIFGFNLRNQRLEQANGLLKLLISIPLLEQQQEHQIELVKAALQGGNLAIAAFLCKKYNLQGCLPVSKYFLAFYIDKAMHDKVAQIAAERDFIPDLEWYNLLIKAFCLQKNLQKMNETVAEAKQAGFIPNITTFNQYIRFYANQLDQDAVLANCSEVLTEITQNKLAFDEETFCLLICKMVRFSNYEQIEAIFGHLQALPDVSLSLKNLFYLSTIFSHYAYNQGIAFLQDYCKAKSISISMNIANIWLEYFFSQCEEAAAIQLLRDCHADGILFNGKTFEILLQFYATHGCVENCRLLLRHMRGRYFSDYLSEAHTSALMSLFYFTSTEKSNPILLKYIPVEQKNGNFLLIPLKAGGFLNASSIKQRFEKIFDVPFKITINFFNDLLLYAYRFKLLPEFSMIYSEMEKSDATPNALTFLLKIKATLLVHDADAAENTLLEMKRLGITIPTLCYALIFHYHCKKLDTGKAEQLLETFEMNYLVKVNYIFYSSLLYAYSKRANYMKVISTFNRLEKQFIISDTETLNYVIDAYYKSGCKDEAIHYFESMKQQNIPRNWFTYTIVIDILTKTKEIAYIYKSVLPDCMIAGNSIAANAFDRLFFYHLANNETEQLKKLVFLMLEYQVRFDYPTIGFISLMIKQLIEEARWAECIQLLHKLATDFSPGNIYIEELFAYALRCFQTAEVPPQQQECKIVCLLERLYKSGDILIAPATSVVSVGFAMKEE